MNWRSERIWIELITGSRKTSNFCWTCILLLGSLGFLLVGTSSYLGRNLITLFPSQEILFFPQGIVMSFYEIAGLFISSYLWCTISWNVGSGYDRFDRKEGILCIFRWEFDRRIYVSNLSSMFCIVSTRFCPYYGVLCVCRYFLEIKIVGKLGSK
ncbi:hypothetical protein MKX03_026430, partial [Papaver bracteatum]